MMFFVRTRVGGLAIMAVALCAGAACAAPLEPLSIETSAGAKRFDVEVARTDEDRTRGLMFRRDLPPDRGMLFTFERNEPIYMWMKNTYLPLDMVFFGRDGRVISIARDTEPLSEKVISSGGAASAVLELNAGTAAKAGIAAGDKLVYPAPAQ